MTLNLDTGLFDKAKPLHTLKSRGYDLTRVLVVDDSPEKHTRNYGNLVQVTPFLGRQDDSQLPRLAPYLRQLSTEPNVRCIEKRRWRTKVLNASP